MCSGISTENELKPKSSVIPLSFDWGFLSKHANNLEKHKQIKLLHILNFHVLSKLSNNLPVLATELKAFTKVVFPLSTCPRTPKLKLRIGIFSFHMFRSKDR